MSIESVLGQTFTDFEIIIGDSSKGQTIRPLAEHFSDERIRYLPVPDSEPFFTFDLPAKAAKGNYLLWLDDDNYLLPFALELFHCVALKKQSDIITANHLYYYDKAHPRLTLRNSLGIVPFAGNSREIDLYETLHDLYAFKRRGGGPRFHTSATIFSKEVAERAVKKVGSVLLTDMPNVHSHQPILFSSARSCVYIDHPVVLIGRLSISMSQSWSTAARTRFASQPFKPRLSPFSAYTRINGIAENYLRVKEILNNDFKDISLNYEALAEIYLKELLYLDTDGATFFKNWTNLFYVLRTRDFENKKSLLARARRIAAIAPFVFVSRRLRLHYVWRRIIAVGALITKKKNSLEFRNSIRGKREFEVSLREYPEIDSIQTLALQVTDIIKKETGVNISEYSIS